MPILSDVWDQIFNTQRDLYEQAGETPPAETDTRSPLEKGIEEFNAGRWDEAATWFNQIPNGGPLEDVRNDFLRRISEKQGVDVQAEFDAPYDVAGEAINKAEERDVEEFGRTSKFVKDAALARLAGRGLGRSLIGNEQAGQEGPVGGYGTGALTEQDVSLTNAMDTIKSGYSGLRNSLAAQKESDTLNLDDFYRNMAKAREATESQKAGATDYLSLIPGVGSLFL